MSLSDPATLSTPAGSTEFNSDDPDGFVLTLDCSGFDAPDSRVVVEDRSQTDGGIVHDGFDGAMHLAVVAQYIINAGTIDDRDAAIEALADQLRSIRNADGTWTHHRSIGDRFLVVRREIKFTSSGGPQMKQVSFGLVAEDPWS